jgi:hypothetical protein
MEKRNYNSRVNIAVAKIPKQLLSMFERTAIKKQVHRLPQPLGNSTENTVLSQLLFFSSENIQIIKNGIKAGVYNEATTEFIPPNQNADELKIIMRIIFPAVC